MSYPNGEQADRSHQAAPQPSSSPYEPAAQASEPSTQPFFTPGSAPVPPAVPAAVPAGVEATVPGGVPTAVVTTDPASPGYPAGYTPESGTSAFPVTGVPVSGYPTIAEPRRKRTGTIVLTVVTIVLGLATAGLGTMYFLEAGARDKADKKVSEQASLLEAADKKLKEAEKEKAQLTQDLTGAKNKTDEVTKARDALIGCMQAIDAYGQSKNAATAKDLIVKCAEAEKYY